MSSNRLRGMRTYLCGPIDRADDLGMGWREDLVPWLENINIFVFNPCNKPIKDANEIEDRELRKYTKKTDYNAFSTNMREIAKTDLRMVDICDFMIVYIDLNIFMCGTIWEIAIANLQKKPILICCKDGKEKIPDWLYGVLPHQEFFSNWGELKAYLYMVDSNDVKPNNRWLFFNKEVLNV